MAQTDSRPGLDFWFDFASTYSYLTAMRLDEAAEAAGVAVTWRPFLLGPIFSGQGWNTSPFNLYPAKGRYMWRDMERLTRERGLPLVQPDPFPQNSVLAARTALAVRKSDAARVPAFCKSLFAAQFGRGSDISDTQTLIDAVAATGLDPASSLELAISPEIKASLRSETELAEGIGIFGAPTFVTSYGELFWGDDRLDQALQWAKRVSR